ncbi:hypothetical protein Pmar_PMAR013698, partial [Perkinsus marinus ATCC 50983]
ATRRPQPAVSPSSLSSTPPEAGGLPWVGDSLKLWTDTRGKALQESYDEFIRRPEAFPAHIAALHPL